MVGDSSLVGSLGTDRPFVYPSCVDRMARRFNVSRTSYGSTIAGCGSCRARREVGFVGAWTLQLSCHETAPNVV